MGQDHSIALSQPLPAGAKADVSMPLKAPTHTGPHRSDWRFFTPENVAFGDVISCAIVVALPAPPAAAPAAPAAAPATSSPPTAAAYSPAPVAAYAPASQQPIVTGVPVALARPGAPEQPPRRMMPLPEPPAAAYNHDLASTADAIAAVEAATRNDRLFTTEMEHLVGMGFANRTRNLELLRAMNGDVAQVVNALIQDDSQGWPARN